MCFDFARVCNAESMATRWQIYWLFIVNVAAIVLPLADRRCKAICNPPIYCRCFSIRLICSDEGMKVSVIV